MRKRSMSLRILAGAGGSLGLAFGAALAVTPGVDIAGPRVAISSVGSALTFNPADLVVEQGDYVSWRFTGGLLSHTTTSGGVCGATTGLWDQPLDLNNPQFDRQFLETPGTIPFHCTPHCPSGMRGQVTVTSPIALTAADSSGSLSLTWTGGGGHYKVVRSGRAPFPGGSTSSFPPDGGLDTGTSFTDPVVPSLDSASFYLVINSFPGGP